MQWRTTCIHRDKERFGGRGVGRSQVFLRGGASQRGGRPNETRGARLWVGGEGGGGAGELGCLRLYYKCFEKHGYFSNFGTSKLIIFCKETTLLLSVRWWMCIRGEPLLCLDYSFLPQKTADNLNYTQRKRDAQKTNNMYLHLLQAHVDPTSTLCNWLFNGQFEKENSHSLKRPNKCVQSETVVPLWPESENKKKLGRSMSKLLQGISYPVILLN